MIKIEAGKRIAGKTPVAAAESSDEYKVSELVTSDVLPILKDAAKFVRLQDISSTYNHAADDIFKNRKYTVKELKADIKILQDGLKQAGIELGNIIKDVGAGM